MTSSPGVSTTAADGVYQLQGLVGKASHILSDMPAAEEEPPPLEERLGVARRAFIGWHRQPSFWREVYTRSVSTLVAAFVAYLIAVISGQVTIRPLLVVLWAAFGLSCSWFLWNVVVTVPMWRYVRPLFVRWSNDPAPERVRARRIYASLAWSSVWVFASGGLLFTVLFVHGPTGQ